jgi:hypothetical protein
MHKVIQMLFVISTVFIDLLAPEVLTGCREFEEMTVVSMPETTMDKHSSFKAGENDIRGARHGLYVETESVT